MHILDRVKMSLEGVGIAFDSMRANKVRAGLTILGVAVGVLRDAVVLHEVEHPDVPVVLGGESEPAARGVEVDLPVRGGVRHRRASRRVSRPDRPAGIGSLPANTCGRKGQGNGGRPPRR